jgi:hypothetical protein
MSRTILWAVAALLAGAPSIVSAHVIPPEKLHPVAEAYRRAYFLLEMNPVVWEQAQPDIETIGHYWSDLDAEAGARFLEQAREIITAATIPADEELGVEPLPRRTAASRIFQLATHAVTEIGKAELHRAYGSLNDFDSAKAALRRSQGSFEAFGDVLRAADPQAYRQIGVQWLDLFSALGSPGLLGEGAAPADSKRFENAGKEVLAYMEANFGEKFQPPHDRPLAPWPVNSPTYDADADLPIKTPPGGNVNKQLPRPRQILNMASRGVDESETNLIAMGDMAFDSPFILGEPARSMGISCNTCHNKSITNPQFFIPGVSSRPGTYDVSNSLFAPHANNGHFDAVVIPDLRGIRFTGPYGRNGRFASLREFVRNGIVNEFNGPEPDPVLLDGIIAYMFEFDFLSNALLNEDGTLDGNAPEAAQRGEKIFNRPFERMGGMSCATCHIPSANFIDHKRHDIGTANGYEDLSRDRAMETPTLLGIKYTPPYFHDGSQPTLRGVVDWFNEHNGLGLSERELSDLTAYVETVGDGVEAYEDTTHTLDAEMEEFSFFLSAYEFLEQRRKYDLASTTFQTIAFEIRAHKWDLQDYSFLPVLEEMASLMDKAYEANEAGDRRTVRRLIAEYRQVYEANVDGLK